MHDFTAPLTSLSSIVIVEQVGLDKLTNGYGLLCVFRGVAYIFGSPLAGFVYDQTGDYNYSFVLSGVLLIVAGLVGFIPIYKQHRRSHENNQQLHVKSMLEVRCACLRQALNAFPRRTNMIRRRSNEALSIGSLCLHSLRRTLWWKRYIRSARTHNNKQTLT